MIRNILKDSIFYGISTTLNKFVVTLLIPLYTRIFSTEEFGTFDLIMSIISASIIILGLQIESGVARYYYETEEKGEIKDLLGTAIVIIIISSIIGLPIIILISQKYLTGYKGISWIFLLLAFLSVPFGIMHNLLLTLLRLQKKIISYSILSIGDVLIMAILAILLIFLFKTGLKSVFFAFLISKNLFTIIGLFMIKKTISLNFSINTSKKILFYSIPLIPAVLSNWAQNYANRFIILGFLTLSAVGIFGFAARIGSIVLLVDQGFKLAWDPYAIKVMEKEESKEIYPRVLRYYLLIMTLFCSIISLFSKEVVYIFGGQNYLRAIPIGGFIVFGYLWRGSVQIFGLGNLVCKKTYFNTLGFILGSSVNLIVLYLLIKKFSIMAAGISFLLGSFVIVLIIFIFAQRNYYIPYSYPRIVASGIITIVVLYLSNKINMLNSNILFSEIILKIFVLCILGIILSKIMFMRDDFIKIIGVITNLKLRLKENV
ncbi:MAG: oligosaccharide flippase family protein [Candidatus Aenigmatarchaeota archaeon]